LPAHQDARSDASRTGEARLRGDEGARSNFHVVADVDVSVELCPAPDRRRAQSSRVHGRTCADFDLVLDDDSAELRHSDDLTGRPRREAEPLTPDHGEGPDYDASADANAPVHDRILADHGALSDRRAAQDDRAGAHHDGGVKARFGVDVRPFRSARGRFFCDDGRE
jgi:hypothetical protein